ncbi:7TM diverse intracellular signaling domain-containing protein [Oligoflexus tunisiensis]|uniref:7TM diverse intracellular signaling domain-containing protein n=1 Tax=Oligoflexus tunisiensis TaxID=708132 RepID=UPI00114CDB49|nr:7TM diverse intracellular signaling domain-containing protein [Oligoflexus tunisiensis]
MKHILAVIITGLLLLGGAPGIGWSQPASRDGWLDLQKTSLSDDVLDLTGPWDFYWQELRSPTAVPWPEPRQTIAIGRPWDQVPHPDTGASLGATGYGTYRLRVTGLMPRPDGYQVGIRSAATSYKLFVYREGKAAAAQLLEAGKVAPEAAESVPLLRPLIISFYPESPDEVWTLVVHVSNFHYGKGGLWSIPQLGGGTSVAELHEISRMSFIFSTGVIVVIGLYNLMLYMRRREDKASGFLAVFCLVMAMRAVTSGQIPSYFMPDAGPWLFKTNYAFEYLTLIFGPWSYAVFNHLSFRPASHVRVIQVFTVIVALLTLVVLCFDLLTYSRFLLVFQANIGLQSSYSLLILARATWRKEEGARLALAGCVIVFSGIVYDILITLNILPQPYILQYAIGIFVFLQSQVVATRFATAFRTAQRLKSELQREVERQTAELRSIMEHVPQGIFMIQPDLTIQGNYALYLEELFQEKDLKGRSALEVMFAKSELDSEARSLAQSALVSALGEEDLLWETNRDCLPTEYAILGRDQERQIVEVEWHPIINSRHVMERILVSVRNVTQVRVLQEQQRKNQGEWTILIELLASKAPDLERFFEKAQGHIQRACRMASDPQGWSHEAAIRAVFIELHTLKGLARSLHFKTLTSVLHETEQAYGTFLKDGGSWEADKQRQALARLNELIQSYQNLYRERLQQTSDTTLQAHDLRKDLSALESSYTTLEGSWPQGPVWNHLKQALQGLFRTWLLRSCHELFNQARHVTSQLATELGKPEPRWEVQLPDIHLTKAADDQLQTLLLHLVRNTLDHGLEGPDERRQKGKEARGIIAWSLVPSADGWDFTFRDDGRGIDLDQLKERGQAKGLLTRETASTVVALLFSSGFSTRDAADEISGRGMGMEAVRLAFQNLGGTCELVVPDPHAPAHGTLPFHLKGRLPASCFLQDHDESWTLNAS